MEVVDELPEKTEIFRTVPMSTAETVAYETMRLEAKNELDADNKLNMNDLAAITRLREAACAMSLVRNGWTEEPSKVAAVRELIGDIVSGGNSVLVFSQFTGFLDIVSAALEKDGIAHFYLFKAQLRSRNGRRWSTAKCHRLSPYRRQHH